MGADYVNRLYDMVIRNLPEGYKGRFICFTDDPTGLHEGIVVKSLPEGLDGWWNKLYLFSPDAFEAGERVLYFDLDTAIVSKLDDIAAYKGDFAILRDFYRPEGWQSSVMAWEAGKLDFIWKDWLASGAPKLRGGDQSWIEAICNFLCVKPDLWQDILPHNFVSYKVHAQQGIPKGARAVVFHGQPRPHEVIGNWVEKIWKVGGGSSLELDVGANVGADVWIKNIQHSIKLQHEWLTGDKLESGHAVIVGGGASINGLVDELAWRKSIGQKIIALNGTAKWLCDHNIIPDYHVILDARPENANFITDCGCKHLIASVCDAELFNRAGDNVMLWHPLVTGIQDYLPKDREYALVGGGSTVGLKTMALAHIIGFEEIHLYGFDSCYHGEDGHAYPQELNKNERVIDIEIAGRAFKAAAWMVTQAEEFQVLAMDLVASGRVITVHGDGLIPYIATLFEPSEYAPDVRAGEILSRLGGVSNPVCAEIGVFAADLSKRLLGRRSDMTLYMVDPWVQFDSNSEYAKTDFHGKLEQFQQDAFKDMAIGAVGFAGDRAKVIQDYSVPAAELIPDGYLDLCFVDADHTYDAVKADLAAWLPKVKKGGWISGHDYNHPEFPEWGVKRAVDEFAASHGLTIETGGNYTWFARVSN